MDLKEYRRMARKQAIFRDQGLCMICMWNHHQRTRFAHVHHIFGRGAQLGSVKEDVSSLMCVCEACHPQPIMIYSEHSWKTRILSVWHCMNHRPQNPDFIQTEQIIKNPLGLETFKVSPVT